mgnify:CR=1 FL=1
MYVYDKQMVDAERRRRICDWATEPGPAPLARAAAEAPPGDPALPADPGLPPALEVPHAAPWPVPLLPWDSADDAMAVRNDEPATPCASPPPPPPGRDSAHTDTAPCSPAPPSAVPLSPPPSPPPTQPLSEPLHPVPLQLLHTASSTNSS